MPNTPEGMRECPTRVDGTNALFAHVIELATCQQRQRQHYHKCPMCTFHNARAGAALSAADKNGHALPLVARQAPLETPSHDGGVVAATSASEALPRTSVTTARPEG